MFDFDLRIRCGRCQKMSVPAIAKNADRLVERYTVFLQVACGFLIIPFELEHEKYLKGLTCQLTGRRSRPLQRPVKTLLIRAQACLHWC